MGATQAAARNARLPNRCAEPDLGRRAQQQRRTAAKVTCAPVGLQIQLSPFTFLRGCAILSSTLCYCTPKWNTLLAECQCCRRISWQEMASIDQQLYAAARSADLARLRACLAAGADSNYRHPGTYGHVDALHAAARSGHPGCVAELLSAGADPNALSSSRGGPLLLATIFENLSCVQLLLAAGADPALSNADWTPVHFAAHKGLVPALELMLTARPEAALVPSASGGLPLATALASPFLPGGPAAARCLLASGTLPPASKTLAILERHPGRAEPLYGVLAARQSLTAAQWARVPSPCRGLADALPAVLQRSTEEAALLMQHLGRSVRERLRTFALCLARAQSRQGTPHRPRLATLPTALVWHLLALAAG